MECDEDVDTRSIRVLPDTCVELFINYTTTPIAIIGNELYTRSIITFRMSRYTDVQMRKGAGCMAICFYPGKAYKFFHLPMHELSDTITAMADVWEDLATEIEDKLVNAHDNKIRVAIVQQYLLQQLFNGREDRQVAYCLQQARLNGRALSVTQLSNAIGISQRQLARKFQDCIGLSPKEYLRINRFIQSWHYMKQYPARSLTDIAYESGYYDQAHFIRECRNYTGLTPGKLIQSTNILY